MAPILYKKQRQILGFLKQYIQTYGVAPTLRQIAEAIDVSSLATVHEHLERLEAKGVIEKNKNKSRSIVLLEGDTDFSGNNAVSVPILGFIAAGAPIEPYHDPNATLDIAPSFVSGKKRIYVLQVRGESMRDEHITDGDHVVIEETDQARNGDIVVALLENGMATLKHYFKEATRIRLQPANAKMQPIFVKNVKIQGKVIGLIRRYH